KELIKENINTDTILIIDTSGSMTGDKLDKVKSDSVDLIQKTLQDNNNKIGIIEFNDNASIVSNLSNDISDLTNKINSLTASGNANYYQALVKLAELLKTYQKEDNKELAVLFLTDGLPNINTPNEVGQYKYLKSEYPYLNINGIQYEMGDKVLDEIESISDNQFIADMNTLNNVLIDALSLSEMYNEFEVTDYINTEHFNIEDKNAITTSTGKFTLDKANGKVTWNLDGLSSGTSATMTIDVYLKEEYIDNFNLYKTNTKEEVTSEIKGIKENISKTDTPILSNGFTVIYDENVPEGCSVEGAIPDTKDYSTFNPVKIENVTLTCGGYEFQGWEVVNKENVSMIGNNHFVSDGNDIKLRAIWSKVSLNKSMDGTVHEVKPVIKVAQYYQGDFWSDTYKLNTTKIVIQNELNPIEEAVEFWDVSEANDGSVMAYAVLNEDGQTYTIYLQGPGKILANENSTDLFYNFTKLVSIDGLEYLDTSNVTSMLAMFYGCSSLTNLDLSNFDTSKVTTMMEMFGDCSSLTTLDLSNFDTSKVTKMASMFWGCGSLTTLDVSNFDTSKVTTMQGMFQSCSSLTTIDFRNADFSSVTSYVFMFRSTSNLSVIVKDESARSWIQDKLRSSGTAIIAS
ncbi:MAG: BspA family leucine-rich repeat surface protein, partial [Bacilli bacterium]|nr:BspA family leucine-rich repeat surface protein [Bacilli bacterium]